MIIREKGSHILNKLACNASYNAQQQHTANTQQHVNRTSKRNKQHNTSNTATLDSGFRSLLCITPASSPCSGSGYFYTSRIGFPMAATKTQKKMCYHHTRQEVKVRQTCQLREGSKRKNMSTSVRAENQDHGVFLSEQVSDRQDEMRKGRKRQERKESGLGRGK